MLRGHGASLQAFSRTVPVGAAEPSGRDKPLCASASPPGLPPRQTLSAACKPSSAWHANWRSWKLSLYSSEGLRLFAAVWSDKMHFKQAVPLNGTQSSRAHVRLFVAALLLIAGGAWLALVLQARSMGLMPVT